MKTTLAALLATLVTAFADEPIAIGSRRELFVDRLLVGELKNTALKLHTPQLAAAVSPPRPQGHYATVLKAEDKFQFYYRGDKDPKVTWKTHGIEAYHEGEVTLYAESTDAIHWTLPKLGVVEHPAFPQGNIVLMDEFLVNHNFTPPANPCSPVRCAACRAPSACLGCNRPRCAKNVDPAG